MKLRYRAAVIGFCPDLTDPAASSIPVACLLVGEAEGERLGAAVVVLPTEKQVALDDLSRMMLGDVPALLRRHLEEVMQTLPADAPLETILYSLHNGLRNSLQVLEIELDIAMRDGARLAGILRDSTTYEQNERHQAKDDPHRVPHLRKIVFGIQFRREESALE